jgi:hypothetical protein
MSLPPLRNLFGSCALLLLLAATTLPLGALEPPPAVAVPEAEAATPEAMKPYKELLEHTEVKVEMLPAAVS